MESISSFILIKKNLKCGEMCERKKQLYSHKLEVNIAILSRCPALFIFFSL